MAKEIHGRVAPESILIIAWWSVHVYVLERDFRCGLNLSAVFKFQQAGVVAVAKATGEQYWGEGLLVGVVGGHGIVKGLAGKGYFILGSGQLFRDLHHVLIGFEIRIGFHHYIEAAHRLSQDALGFGQSAHSYSRAGRGGGGLQAGHSTITRSNYSFQRFAFMLEVTLWRFQPDWESGHNGV